MEEEREEKRRLWRICRGKKLRRGIEKKEKRR